MVFSLDATANWWRGSEQVEVIFQDVKGLKVSDPVLFHGVTCGRVEAIEFRTQGGPQVGGPGVAVAASSAPPSSLQVALTLRVTTEVRELLRADSPATIDKTLTGVTVVNLFQGDGSERLTRGALRGTQRAAIEDVTDELHGATLVVQEVLVDVREMLRQVKQDGLVANTLASVRDISNRARGVVTSIEGVFESNEEDLRTLVREAKALAGQLNAASRDLPDLLAEFQTTARNTRGLAYEARDWLRGARPALDSTVEDVAKTADQLALLTSELRYRPWRLLHAPGKDEVREMDLFQSASNYGRGAVDLRRSADRLAQLLEWVREEPDLELEQELRQLVETLDARLSRQGAFEKALWERIQNSQD